MEPVDLEPSAVLPQPTLEYVAQLVQEFRRRKVSGNITIVLHFFEGDARPSDVGMHERQVGSRKSLDRAGRRVRQST